MPGQNAPFTTTVQTAIACLRDVPHLVDVPECALYALAAVACPETYPAGAGIFWEGDPVAGLYVVDEGLVKVCRYSRAGREHILALMGRGDFFNAVAVMDGGPNPATAIAHTRALVWRIPRADFRRVVTAHPEVVWALGQSIAYRTRHLVRLVEDVTMHSVKGRLARLLLDQARSNEDNAVPKLLTQEEMAAHLGTVREMVGRALRSLAAAGIIEFDRHRILILDVERLAEEAHV